MANHALQGAVELAHVGVGHRRNVARHLLAQGHAAAFGLALQDGDPHRLARRLDLHVETAAQARLQAALEALHEPGIAVAGDHDLPATIPQPIEYLKKFLLSLGCAGYELNVVNQQRIGRLVAPRELLHGAAAQANGFDHAFQEDLAVAIHDAHVRVAALNEIANGLHEMGLAEADRAMEQQRVVVPAWIVRHLLRRDLGEPVRLPFNEVLEGVGRVQPARPSALAVAALKARLGAPWPGLRRLPNLDFEVLDQAVAAEFGEEFNDERQILPLDCVTDVAVGRVQLDPALNRLGLEWSDGGVKSVGRNMLLQLLQTRLPWGHERTPMARILVGFGTSLKVRDHSSDRQSAIGIAPIKKPRRIFDNQKNQ